MTILEQALVPKSPAKRSEDGIVVTPDFIAVIDGSTSKSTRRCHRDPFLLHDLSLPIPWPRKHSNGELAMLITSNFIKKMKKDTTCHQFCTGVTAAVRSHYKKDLLPHLAQHPEDRLTASCIVFSRLRREIWMVGDCQALITPLSQTTPVPPSQQSQPSQPSQPSQQSQQSQPSQPSQPSHFLDNPKPYEQELAERRAAIIKASPKPWEHFLTDDTARAAIIPRMLETMQHQNNGYSVVDGFPIDKQHVRIIPLDFQPWEVILASDGYPFLCPTLAESEERLAHQREEDPLNIGEFKATKAFIPGNNSFDDRAFIRFRC